MCSIKDVIIASTMAAIAAAVCSVVVIYKYQKNGYEAIIAKKENAAVVALQEATEKTLIAERKNSELSASMDAKYDTKSKEVDKLRSTLNAYVSRNGSMRVSSVSCVSEASATNQATGSLEGAPTQATGVCELAGEFATFLIDLSYAADSANEVIAIANEYAIAVEEQRKQLQDE